jgi:HK97 family phage major capsid protein
VLTDELVRFSSPSAEDTVRRDLVAQISAFLDKQFLDPSVTASANNPASVTNGVTGIAASGTDADALYYDLQMALSGFINSDMGLDTGVWVMRPGTALGISMLRNALGQLEFTGVGRGGGTLMGIPVVVSNNAPAGTIVFIAASEILLADDGNVTLDASREATLDMNGGTTPNFSLFQRNAVAIRAERWITWRKRRAAAVSVITGAAYGPAAPETP